MPLFQQKIFFGNPVDQFKSYQDEILEAIKAVCCTGPHVLGPVVEKFEQEFAAWNGVRHAVGVGSGTDALVLALRAYGIGPGDEVITVSHTALATIAAIVLAGATPVLVDVDADTALMDPKNLEAALTPRTRAIIPVHLYGFCCPMDDIMRFANAHNLIVIEDCAQAHGATYKGQKAGSIGHAGCFSFYPTKNLGAVGDGGCVITNDAETAEHVRQLRQYGWDAQRIANRVGNLSRLDPIQAAILSIKLKHLDHDNQRRRGVADVYNKTLNWNKFSRFGALPEVTPVYHLYVLLVKDREALQARCSKENIELGVHYAHPAHMHPGYTGKILLPTGGLPVTENLSRHVLSLPIYPEFPAQSAKIIAEYINE